MQDIFIEHMVVRKKTAVHYLITVAIVLGLLIAVALLFVLVPPHLFSLGLLVIVGLGWGAYTLIRNMNVEYEYLVTNGEIDVDKIIAQSRRKRLITTDARQMSDIGPYDPEKHQSKSYNHTIMACDSPQSEDLWYFVTEHRDKGRTLVVFNGAQRVLNAIKPFLPRPLMQKAFIDRNF